MKLNNRTNNVKDIKTQLHEIKKLSSSDSALLPMTWSKGCSDLLTIICC